MGKALAVIVAVAVIGGILMLIFIPPKSGSDKIVDAFKNVKIDTKAVDNAVSEGERLKAQIEAEQKAIEEAKQNLQNGSRQLQDEIIWDMNN